MKIQKTKCEGFTLIETIIALAVFLIIMGSAIEVVARMMLLTRVADRNMLVSTENQKLVKTIKQDLYCSSRYTQGDNAPVIDASGELRFRVVTDFEISEEVGHEGEGGAIYSGYQVCYYHDSAKKFLIRRFRDTTGVLLNEAPADYPGPANQVIGQYVESIEYSINAEAGMVSISLKTSIGNESDDDYLSYSEDFFVIPYNAD